MGLGKILGGLAVAGLIAGGGYYLYEKDPSQPPVEKVQLPVEDIFDGGVGPDPGIDPNSDGSGEAVEPPSPDQADEEKTEEAKDSDLNQKIIDAEEIQIITEDGQPY